MPISTHRNYIVLLPAVAFLLANMIEHTSRNTLRAALLAVCAAVKIHRKAYSLENWQTLNRMASGPTYYLLTHPVNRLIQQRIVDFYLDHKAQPITPEAVTTLHPPYYVVAAHKEALVARLAANPTIHARYPRDGSA